MVRLYALDDAGVTCRSERCGRRRRSLRRRAQSPSDAPVTISRCSSSSDRQPPVAVTDGSKVDQRRSKRKQWVVGRTVESGAEFLLPSRSSAALYLIGS